MSPAGQMLRLHWPPTMQPIFVISLPKTMPSVLQSPPHSQKPSKQASRMPRHSSWVSHGRGGTQTNALHSVPGGQSSSVTQVGSGVGVTVGVEMSRQTPLMQNRPVGQSLSLLQAMVGVGVGAVTQKPSGPQTWPTGQSVSRVQGTGLVGVGVGGGVLVLVAGGATVTLARM